MCLFILFSSFAHADIISDTMQGQELLFQRNYPAAIELFQKIEQEYPASPAGAFGQMASYQLMMFENLDFRFRTKYETSERRFEKVVLQMLSGKPKSFDLFVAGAGYGMRGFYYIRDGRWVRAVGSAVRAVQLLKRAAFVDKEFLDARLGIGMYNYWRSALTKGLYFLPFFSDHRAEGIEDIKQVVDNGRFANKLAKANLAFIYSEEHRHLDAQKALEPFLQEYPNNIILRQLSGRLYMWLRQYDKSLQEFEKILKIDPSMTKTYFYMGVVMMRKPGFNVLAKKYFEDFLATNPEKEWAEAAHKNLKILRQKT